MTSKYLNLAIGFLILSSLSSCARQTGAPDYDVDLIKTDIKETLARQDAAWNRGDIDAFMEDYLKRG